MPRSCSCDHPVHRRGAFVDLADLVVDARVEEDALGRGGLARIDVRHDADVADAFFETADFCVGASLPLTGVRGSPPVVREGLVGLGHLVRVLATLDGGAVAVVRVEDLARRDARLMVFSRRARA